MRKLKENVLSSLKLDVVSLSSDFPEISIDELASQLSDNLGVGISKEEQDGTVYMVIEDTDIETAIDEISDILYAESDIEDIDEITNVIADRYEYRFNYLGTDVGTYLSFPNIAENL